MTPTLTLPAPAKLNLFLHITGQRADGYHTLQTVFQILDYGDSLSFSRRQDGEIHLQDNLEGVAPEQNLIVRAARLLQSASGCHFGADISCQKILPQGGGLGGGSSNAATTLAGLNQLWGTNLGTEQLAKLGLQLGADVPVFVNGHSAWAEGVGEALCPLELPTRWYLVISPQVTVSTAMIFADKQLTRNSQPITLAAFRERGGRNDCEAVVRRLFPAVEQTMAWLAQHGKAQLTGTGACVYSAFSSKSGAEAVAAKVPAKWNWFVAPGVIESPLHRVLRQSQ